MLCQSMLLSLIIIHLLLLEKPSNKSNQKFSEDPVETDKVILWEFFWSLKLENL